jgi:creatinine amidohydrolase
MTEFFSFENLTWPEVAALDHAIPLFLPLGTGYSLDSLSGKLGNPLRVGMLPSIPFGWQGSLLPVSPEAFSPMLKNLISGLEEDGFSKVFLLTPNNVTLGLGRKEIHLPIHEIATLQKDQDNKDKVVVIPIGHTEQHALHLPLSTDTLCISAISVGVKSLLPMQVIDLPVIPYGVSTHRKSFAGTLNCGGRAFEDFWLGVIDTLVDRGFEMMYLISGHGGNVSFLTNVVKYAGEKYPDIFCATSWLYLSGPKGAAALEDLRESPIGGMGHACELETSLILQLHPELVHMERVKDEIDFISTPSYYQDWLEGGPLIANPPWSDDTATGAYGAGSLGTAEKGKVWLDIAIEEKRDHVLEIIDQLTRRKARRIQNKTTAHD